MNILVLGGTVFLGRHLVNTLVARGHRVTTFNRGNHAVDVDLPVARMRGDRTNPADLARIPRDGWDAVVDPSSSIPDDVGAAAAWLERAGRYVYISSISAYDLANAPIDEHSARLTHVDGDPLADTAEAYGWRKATSEARLAAVFGARATCMRPGLIVGPYDPTDRFTYWPVRIARGGNVLVPGRPERPVQFIDVRDVADFIVHALERDLEGAYNVTSPRATICMRDVVDAARTGIAALPAINWVDDGFLVEQDCQGWGDLPLWIRPGSPYRGILDVDVSRAVAAGLTYRPLADTVAATRDWFAQTGRAHLLAGLDPARETELLEQWNAVISS